jgi:glycosyltransferase
MQNIRSTYSRKKNTLKVTIITVVYNNYKYIESALKSVTLQDYPNIEYVVIDGGSTDGTLDILNMYSNKISIMVSEPDEGIYDAFNKGLKYSTGDIVGFLNSDDLFETDHTISLLVDAFTREDIDGVYGNLNYVDQQDVNHFTRHWKSSHYSKWKIWNGWAPPHPTFYLKKSVYNQIGTYNSTYRIAADYDLILRVLLKSKFKIGFLDSSIIRMRNGGCSNTSIVNFFPKFIENYKVSRGNGLCGWYVATMKTVRKINQFW